MAAAVGSMMEEPAHWKSLPAGFFDRVRIRSVEETEAAGIAGRCGVVYGITTVAVTEVQVIGRPKEDTAINVSFEDSGDSVWVAPTLVEFIDHNRGATHMIKGVAKAWKRDDSGNWVEYSRRLPILEWAAWIRGMSRRLMRRQQG